MVILSPSRQIFNVRNVTQPRNVRYLARNAPPCAFKTRRPRPDSGDLHLDEAVGAELRGPFCALRGRLSDGAEVGEEPAQQRLREQRERRACLSARPETAASRGVQPIICNVAFRESLHGRTLPAPGYCINFTVSINSDPSFSVSAFKFTTRSSHGASVTDSRRPFGRLRTTDCGRTQSMFST